MRLGYIGPPVVTDRSAHTRPPQTTTQLKPKYRHKHNKKRTVLLSDSTLPRILLINYLTFLPVDISEQQFSNVLGLPILPFITSLLPRRTSFKTTRARIAETRTVLGGHFSSFAISS